MHQKNHLHIYKINYLLMKEIRIIAQNIIMTKIYQIFIILLSLFLSNYSYACDGDHKKANIVQDNTYPKHWGATPERQTRDYVQLPLDYGYGSSTRRNWISENITKDYISIIKRTKK